MSIGISAAAVRINREEKEKGKSTRDILESAKRRWGIAWEQTDVRVGDRAGKEGKKEG